MRGNKGNIEILVTQCERKDTKWPGFIGSLFEDRQLASIARVFCIQVIGGPSLFLPLPPHFGAKQPRGDSNDII